MRAGCTDSRQIRHALLLRRFRWAAAHLALFVTSFLSVADVEADSVRTLHVVEAGTYRAETATNVPTAGTTGLVNLVRNVELLERTTSVPARRGVRFGLRYLVEGLSGTPVDITFTVRFPPVGLRDPVRGRRHLTSTHSKSVPAGVTLYREYHLEHDWEIVPGLWHFEFWHDGLKVGEQTFCLYSTLNSNEDDVSIAHDRECANDLVS